MLALSLLVVLAQQPPLPPPPPPPSSDVLVAPQPDPGVIHSPPVRDENGVTIVPQKRVRVRPYLTSAASNSELYDVTSLLTICRAPCGVWLDTDDTHRYSVRAVGVTGSSEFTLSDFSGDVTINFQHRNDYLRGFGLASTIVGIVGLAAGALVALGWLVVIGLINLFSVGLGGRTVIGGFEFLYFAAFSALGGGGFLTPGLIMLFGGGREKLDVSGNRF